MILFRQILVAQTNEAHNDGSGGQTVSDSVADKSEDPKGGEGYTTSDDGTNEDDESTISTIAELGRDSPFFNLTIWVFDCLERDGTSFIHVPSS